MDVDRLQRSLMECYLALSYLLNDWPKGCETNFVEQAKRLLESYQEVAETEYLIGGNDILASGIVEIGNRTTSSSGRMIARISFEVLEAIAHAATKKPVAICEFEPHLDGDDWQAIAKLSQTRIQSLAKKTAAIDTTKLEGIVRRMLAEFEIVGAKQLDEPTNFQSLSIPLEYRTKAMSKIEALNYIGWPAHCKNEKAARNWLNKSIEDGAFTCAETSSRKRFYWDKRQFPKECQREISQT